MIDEEYRGYNLTAVRHGGMWQVSIYPCRRLVRWPSAAGGRLRYDSGTMDKVARAVGVPFALDIHSVWLPPFYANAGTARRLAMDKAILSAGQRGIVMTMDADAIAPPEWVALNVGALTSGARQCLIARERRLPAMRLAILQLAGRRWTARGRGAS
jgi:hypothetical protein